jgi:gamma-tubulin complex component 2
VTQLEHAFNTSSQFSLQKLWFYVHPTVHTLSLLYQLSTELATADGSSRSRSRSRSPSASDSSDSEDAARDEALGMGGNLKAVLENIARGGAAAGGGPVKGGEVLTIVHERRQRTAGDPAARTLYGALLAAAGRPYVLALQAWVGAGRLEDVYEEVCVKESTSIDRGTLEVDYTDEYWERRYTVRLIFPLISPWN